MNDPAMILASALGVAAAVGLDPYLTLLLFALAPLGGWFPPAGFETLAEPAVVGVAATLFAIEFLLERVRVLGAFWHLLQVVARPVAAALFAYLLVSEGNTEPLIHVVAPLTAAGVALMVHLAKCGWTALAWFDGDPRVRPALVSALEDACVVALVALSIDHGRVAGAIGLGAVVAVVLFGRGVLRAGVFAHVLTWRRSWGSLVPFRWMTEGQLPADLASRVADIPRPLGQTLKVARAGGFRLGGGIFRAGWLVIGPTDPWWIARTVRGTRLTQLDVSGPRIERSEPLFYQVGDGSDPHGPSLILARSGPSLEALNAELSRGLEATEPAGG